jgi:hypothetical protein
VVVARIDIGVGVGFGGDALLVVLVSERRGIRFRPAKELLELLQNLDGCILISMRARGRGRMGLTPHISSYLDLVLPGISGVELLSSI